MSLERFLDRVAGMLFWDEVRHGAYTVDIGFLGPSWYRREVLQALKRLEYDFIEIVQAEDRQASAMAELSS